MPVGRARKGPVRRATKINRDSMRKRITQQSGDWLKIPADTPVRIRVLPPFEPFDTPFAEHWAHYLRVEQVPGAFQVPGDEHKRAVHCLDFHTEDQVCPMCTIQQWLNDEGREDVGVFARQSFLMNVVHNGAMMTFDACPTATERIRAISEDPEYGLTIFDPIKGRDITVKRFRKAAVWDYSAMPAGSPSLVSLESWEADAKDLLQFMPVFSMDKVFEIIEVNLKDHIPLAHIFPRRFGRAAPKSLKKPPAKRKVKATKATKKTGRKKR